LLQPHEIKEIRQQYHLSQRQLAKILGWSHATLSRYETGAIQDTSHNNELVLLRNPENMLEILETNSVNLSEKELKRLKRNVYDMVERDKSRKINILLEQFFCDEPDIMNGYKRFDLDKLVQTVKFFAIKDNKLYKLKLMKYLWYSDFLHFKRHTVSINGLRYAHLPIGPAPDRHDLLIALLLEQSDHIFREYEDFGYEHPGEKFKAVGPLDDSLFDEEELITLNDVYESLNHHSGMSGSDYSHQESAWLKTTNGELISYEFAKELSLIH
jgi:transcriptional regulator with XRE-family HTH domain